MPTATIELDEVCAAAGEVARAALVDEVGAASVGEPAGLVAEDALVVSHLFGCLDVGYRGWQWSVTLLRAPDSDHVTVGEIVLLPAEGAIVAPAWVPWSERLRPGDLGVGDLLPTSPDDDRLAPGYSGVDEEELDELLEQAWQLGLGRARVLSLLGRDDASDRWYDGDGGPAAPIAKAAPATCSTCGFWVPLSGALGQVFGACANQYAPDDRGVVSADHGCGAHSEVLVMASEEPMATSAPLLDDAEIEPVALGHEPGSVDAEAAEPLGHS